MAEKELLYKSKARHIGLFDFKETYRVLYEWLVHEGYEVDETAYKEIIGAGGAKEVDIFWEASRELSSYFKSLITVRFHPIGMTAVEVKIDNVDQKMNKGDLTIEFSCSLIRDYKNRFESNNFSAMLRRFYDKYLVKERTEQHQSKVISEMEALVEYVKSFLALTGTK
jgi:hypothetical protein